MTLEDYPEDIAIQKTNFKTDQQEEAAETIAEEWPIDLDTLAEEGQHVKMFYSQVLDQFLGPADTEMTFSQIESEHGSIEQWAEGQKAAADAEGEADDDPEADVEVPGVEDIDTSETVGHAESENGATASEESPSVPVDAESIEGVEAADIGEKQREWFAAGFREGVEFARRNPDLFESD